MLNLGAIIGLWTSLEPDDMTEAMIAIEEVLTEATDAHHRHTMRKTIVQAAEAMTVHARDPTHPVSNHLSSLTFWYQFLRTLMFVNELSGRY